MVIGDVTMQADPDSAGEVLVAGTTRTFLEAAALRVRCPSRSALLTYVSADGRSGSTPSPDLIVAGVLV